MGDGIKAMHEEAREEAHKDAVKRLKKVPIETLLYYLESAEDNLAILVNSDRLALTKGHRHCLERAYESIQKALK